ncbi:MAG: hypothetical protein ACRCT8_06980 [Lacipirellulaceae bacterium]
MLDDRSKDEREASVARRFFAGITEQAFMTELGVADPPLIDYVAGMLWRFVRADDVYGVRGVRGERLTQVADMLAEAQSREGLARRRLLRHIGDFTLFWTGVFPEVAERLRKTGAKDALLDYRELGKRSYRIAAQIPAPPTHPSTPSTDDARAPTAAELLERLSAEYELCVYGLGEVRKAWEEREGGAIVV